MEQLSGAPGPRTNIAPMGAIPANTIKGIICVHGETARGEVGKNYLVGSWDDFKKYLGGFIEDSDFPLQCKQALETGARLRVSRSFHFTDIDDASTVEGDVATGSIANAAVASVSATALGTIATWNADTSSLVIAVPNLADPSQTINIANYTGTSGQTAAQAATAVAAAINAGTGTHKYSATNPSGASLVISAPSALGSLANSLPITFTPTSATLSGVSSTFSGGVYVGGAYVNARIATWTGSGSNFKLVVPNLNGSGSITLVDYAGLGSQTIPAALIAIAGVINTDTVTHGYTAKILPTNTLYVFKSNATGAGGNDAIATFSIANGTLSGIASKFYGGVTAYGSLTSTWDAVAVGSGYDGSTITISNSANGVAGFVDIVIQLKGAPLAQTVSAVSRVLTTPQLVSLNKQMQGVNVSGLTSLTLPIGTVTLAGGTQDISLINDVDYGGSTISKTGFHSFDSVSDSMRLFLFSRPTHGASLALQTYLEGRKNMRGRVYTPKGLTIEGLNDYIDGTGPYVHQPLNSLYLDRWEADIEITDPNNLNVPDYVINGGGFQAGARTIADVKGGEWISDSDEEYGKILAANGVPLDLGGGGNGLQWGNLYEKGLNAIVNDSAIGISNCGNRSTLRDKTSLLSKSNNADGVVFIANEVKKIAKKMGFKPNDLIMFAQLYLKVRPFIVDVLVAGRAIEGKNTNNDGEGKWWYWVGDQFAKDLAGLKYNNAGEVDSGKYRCKFIYKPISANEYIGIELSPADTVTILSVGTQPNLF